MGRELPANRARALPAKIRPAADVAAIRLQIARDHLADIRALDARLKARTGLWRDCLAGERLLLLLADGQSGLALADVRCRSACAAGS